MKPIDIRKHISLNLGGLICLVLFVYIIYAVLLRGNIFPFSISSVQTSLNHWSKHWHILMVGLLPIYVAFVFFSTAIVGFLFGSALQRWLSKILQEKSE